MTSLPSANLSEQYKDRLDVAWESLGTDVQRWLKAVPDKTTIAHHIREFDKFRVNAFNALVPLGQARVGTQSSTKIQEIGARTLDAEDFRALVIGVLTAHWSLLRQVASQRIQGSPYCDELAKLDELAVRYYHRVRNALPEAVRQNVKASAPLVHLGDMGMITVFNQNVPLVLSVPYNAIDGDEGAKKSQLAIPHEIGHAVLLQLPEVLEEIRERLTSDERKLTKRQQVLSSMIAGWIAEIWADMAGTALAGSDFASSAIWITATSENNVGMADGRHPPTVVRPFIHLKILEYLDSQEKSMKRAPQIDEIKTIRAESTQDLRELFIAQTVGPRLSRQFRSIPALTFMTLEEVRDALEAVVTDLLAPTTKLDSLGCTIGEFLVNCSNEPQITSLPKDELFNWGEIPEAELEQYALAMPTGAGADFHTPLVGTNGFCEYLPFLPFCHSGG